MRSLSTKLAAVLLMQYDNQIRVDNSCVTTLINRVARRGGVPIRLYALSRSIDQAKEEILKCVVIPAVIEAVKYSSK